MHDCVPLFTMNVFTMLCASVLAALEEATPIEEQLTPPSDEIASTASSPSLSISSGESPTSSTLTAFSLSSPGRVAAVKQVSAHSKKHTETVDSIEKWIVAALTFLKKIKKELIFPSLEPNNPLASDVLAKLTEWYTSGIIAKDAGDSDYRTFILDKPIPRENQRLAKCWMRRYINEKRTEHDIPDLHEKWSGDLSNSKGNARLVSKVALKRGAENGTLYHYKHDCPFFLLNGGWCEW